ncbi:putative 12.4 kDa protein in nrdA-td intergenic region [Dissostichus eleginoides]|uniref:12.4 kDa protein in nrdA-td intergenic region n=1 Tax=Dissostichus eleginoides TaxID=100907 RepID=A0AAD9BV71_DISEL|nr:putative 12.4 kDa protein in nrdA-td intergenic region [Dissostichus eleginoides]
MEVQDRESLGRWEGLGSRDAISRTEAMENIRQDVMRRVETIRPITSLAPASKSPPKSDLNDILAHLLMLTKRCPFDDVKEQCVRILQGVQASLSGRRQFRAMGPPRSHSRSPLTSAL